MTNKFTPYLKPNEILSKSEINFLKEKSDIKGIFLLVHAWLIICLSVIIYSLFPNIFTFIADRQIISYIDA